MDMDTDMDVADMDMADIVTHSSWIRMEYGWNVNQFHGMYMI